MADITRKKQLGQFFTTDPRVHVAMLSMVGHVSGDALEPSAGTGDLAAVLQAARPGMNVEAVEFDTTLAWEHDTIKLRRGDFFDYATADITVSRTYDVVFGNPPYVPWRDVDSATRTACASVKARYQDKANLFHLFMDRCVDLLAPDGEMVFIVPLEWCFATAAAPLRAKMAAEGAVTDFIHCGEEKLFSDAAVPALCIFRFVRGATQGPVRFSSGLDNWIAGDIETRTLHSTDDRWMLLDAELATAIKSWGRLGDQFDVKVGLVTGADKAFKLTMASQVEADCVLAQVTTKKATEPFLFLERFERLDQIPPRAASHISASKQQLLDRRIAKFDESNWWRYGAVRNESAMSSPTERFFALAKTRDAEPFFDVPGATHFTGGVLGLFRRPSAMTVADAIEVCNSAGFRRVLDAMFLTSGSKLSLQPATLRDVPFPRTSAQVAKLLGKSPSA